MIGTHYVFSYGGNGGNGGNGKDGGNGGEGGDAAKPTGHCAKAIRDTEGKAGPEAMEEPAAMEAMVERSSFTSARKSLRMRGSSFFPRMRLRN